MCNGSVLARVVIREELGIENWTRNRSVDQSAEAYTTMSED